MQLLVLHFKAVLYYGKDYARPYCYVVNIEFVFDICIMTNLLAQHRYEFDVFLTT